MQTPSIGRIVHYMLTSNQAVRMNELRRVSEMTLGVPLKYGNPMKAGDVFPMIITHVDQIAPGFINGQVFLDGNDILWVEHTVEGVCPGCWQWPSYAPPPQALRPHEGPQGQYYGGEAKAPEDRAHADPGKYNPREDRQWTKEELARMQAEKQKRMDEAQALQKSVLADQRSTDHILTEKELAERPDKHLEDDKRMERGDE